MARLSFLFLLIFLHVVVIVLITSSPCESTTTNFSEHYSPEKCSAALFIFGDSFFDAGNNNYINTTTLDQANFWPYGETFFRFPTGRFSDGRLIPDFVAEYANLPLISPFLQPGFRHYNDGVNFASSGAGALVETFQGSVIDLKTQLRNYKKVEGWLRHKVGSVGAEVTLSKAVYLFSIGTNDYMSIFLTNSTVLTTFSHSQYVHMVIGNLTTVLKEIYTLGGRKFGFMNLPEFGCSPGIRITKQDTDGSCIKEASTLTKLHNQALSKLLMKLEKQLKGFKYSLYDLNSNLRHRMNHPSKFGFKEGKTACCGTSKFRGVFSCGGKRLGIKKYNLCDNPNEYVFWDSYHLTENAYKQLALQMWTGTGISHSVGPYTLKDLFEAH